MTATTFTTAPRETATGPGSAVIDTTGELAIVLAPEPSKRPRRAPGRHLRPVQKPTKKRSPAVPVIVGSGIVLVALFALAAMHALLIGGQLRLDDLRREHAAEAEEVRRQRLRVAELEAPDRVLEVARERLGMVDPGEVGYLLPVGVAGGDESPIRVDPATAPPPPPPPVVQSPEQEEVDAGLTGPPLSEAEQDAATTGTTTGGDQSDATSDANPPDGAASAEPAMPSEGAPDGGTE